MNVIYNTTETIRLLLFINALIAYNFALYNALNWITYIILIYLKAKKDSTRH